MRVREQILMSPVQICSKTMTNSSLLLFVIVILRFHLRFWYRARRLLWKLDKGGQTELNGTEGDVVKDLVGWSINCSVLLLLRLRIVTDGADSRQSCSSCTGTRQPKCCRETFPCSCYVENEGDNLMSAKSASNFAACYE